MQNQNQMNQDTKNVFKKQQPEKPTIQGCIILLVLAVIIFFSVKSCFSSTPEEEKAEAELEAKNKEDNLKIKAYVWSQSCIKQKLKSPGSAEFPFYDEAIINKVNDSVYSVSSYVDSQNSFGALLRAKYVSRITIIDEDHYRCDEVVLLE